MLQLVYVSSVHPIGTQPDMASILAVSRTNNARDRITGLLYCDGMRFLQALEGPDARVEAAYERICADDRHRAQVVLSRRVVAEREFGEWDMAFRESGADAGDLIARVGGLVANASPRVRATFESFVQVRSAA